MDPSSLVTGGGVAGLLGAVVYIGKLLLEWRKDSRTGEIAAKTGTIADAATTNAVALATLKALSEENDRLREVVTEKDRLLAERDAKIIVLERRLAEAQAQLQSIADELSTLKTH